MNKVINKYLEDIQNDEITFKDDFKDLYDRIKAVDEKYDNADSLKNFITILENKKNNKMKNDSNSFIETVASFAV